MLTISEFSRREIVTHFNIDPAKVEVIYPAFSNVGRGTRTQQRSRHMVLFAGSLFNRRHIPELIEGFTRLAPTLPAELEIVGDNRTIPRIDIDALIASSPARDRIALRSYLTEPDLSALYGRARAFVFLSEYEGFGFTPLEALSAGVPIVVLDTPVAREVYGAAALYVEHPEPALIETALARILTDEAERTRILTAGHETLARYSWRRCAERVLDVLLHCSD